MLERRPLQDRRRDARRVRHAGPRRAALDSVGSLGRRAARSALPRRDRPTEAWRLDRAGRRAAERRRRRAGPRVSGDQSRLGRSDCSAARRDRRRHRRPCCGCCWRPSACCCSWPAPTSRCSRSCAAWIDPTRPPCAWRSARRRPAAPRVPDGVGAARRRSAARSARRSPPPACGCFPRSRPTCRVSTRWRSTTARSLFVAAAHGALGGRVGAAAGLAAHALLPPTAGRSAAPRTTDGRHRHLLRDAIVVSQVAMAVVLMAGSGLLVRSFLHLRGADPGFDPRGVLVAPIFLDSQAYNSGERTRTYYRTLFERLSALPGVDRRRRRDDGADQPARPGLRAPGLAGGMPRRTARRACPRRSGWSRPDTFERSGCGSPTDARSTIAIQPTSHAVLMVNETLAARLWPGQRAVGRQLVVDYSTAGTYPYEIVGVVGDVRFRGPRSEPQAEIYFPHAQRPYLIMNVVLKSAGDPRALIPAVRDVEGGRPAEAGARAVSARGSARRHLRARSTDHGDAAAFSPARRSSSPCSASTACCRSAFASDRARSASAWRWAPTRRAWSAGSRGPACA